MRPPAAAVTRPPGYEEAVSFRSRTSSGPLGTIEEEHSIASRAATPEIPLHPGDGDRRPDRERDGIA